MFPVFSRPIRPNSVLRARSDEGRGWTSNGCNELWSSTRGQVGLAPLSRAVCSLARLGSTPTSRRGTRAFVDVENVGCVVHRGDKGRKIRRRVHTTIRRLKGHESPPDRLPESIPDRLLGRPPGIPRGDRVSLSPAPRGPAPIGDRVDRDAVLGTVSRDRDADDIECPRTAREGRPPGGRVSNDVGCPAARIVAPLCQARWVRGGQRGTSVARGLPRDQLSPGADASVRPHPEPVVEVRR